ncbi:hypothetical protein M947_08565 [Sulfurimonas hongkongensis]|uniref:4Fe4S-binding SPASM domain-containing protein n=1 Tax=Sulfurimonas hongkongensis TaxID=1172190 RepID=T0JM91_9BACT|nr:SPASM domain-containing protein [Sulfurimonas hongkongensis]EQB39196.1 hypothetical protein M947_08565 [Sulfurimonas hongkongensis]
MVKTACHKEGLFIQSNGDVFPCCGTWNKPNMKIGNIRDNDLESKIKAFSAVCKCESYELVSGSSELGRYKEINIETSYACQATCAMCCVNAPESDGYYNNENYLALMKLLKLTNPDNIMVQGGEILVQNETMNWISQVKQEMSKSNITLITNGNNIKKVEYAKETFDNIQVSFVGFQNLTYKTLMGLDIKHTFNFCEQIFNSASSNLFIKYLLSPLNLHELPLFIEWSMGINPKGVIIHDSNTSGYINYKTGDDYWNKIIQRTREQIVKTIHNNKHIHKKYNFKKIIIGGNNIAKLLQIDEKYLKNNKIDDFIEIQPVNYRFINSFESDSYATKTF